MPVRIALTLAAVDLVGYWVHRLFHGPRRLWKVHAVHHATRELDWFSAARNHPLNEAIGHALIGSALVAAGLDPRIVAGAGPLLGVWALLLHANVRWRFGWLRFVVATPGFHRWHHALREGDGPPGGCNFAALLPIWDLLFGTFHLPDRQPSEFGAGEPVPESLVGQLAFPFRSGLPGGYPRRSCSRAEP